MYSKNMKSVFVISLFFILLLSSCKDNGVEPKLSISQEINNIRPLHSITVHQNVGHSTHNSYPPNGFTDAYARDGYLIIIYPQSNYYFNLSSALEVHLYDHSVRITY